MPLLCKTLTASARINSRANSDSLTLVLGPNLVSLSKSAYPLVLHPSSRNVATLTHSSRGTSNTPIASSSTSSSSSSRFISNMATNGEFSTGEHAAQAAWQKPKADMEEVNAWQQPGPAAYDFRSDTITTPTASMLNAIAHTTLLDDVFVEDPTTNNLEAHVAALTGHDAALYVLSGTMGNQIALRTHLTQPPHAVLCDHRAHILEWESGGVASLSGALVKGVVPANGLYLTLADIEKHAVLSDDVHACPTRVISLENTIGGTVTPLADMAAISRWARAHDLKLHLDGARIWEAVASGAGSLADYCALFDSVSLCFSKGLGAPVGSILVGAPAFIKHARWVRKTLGGGLRQAGVLTAAARVAVDETFGAGPWGKGGKLQATHARAKAIGAAWTALGGALEKPVDTNMVWLDLRAAGVAVGDFVAEGHARGLRFMGGRLVVHYQICDDAVRRLEDLFAFFLTGDGRAELRRARNGAGGGTVDAERWKGQRIYFA
ncbi:MAG: hypothetical protein M1819_004923 [Sarea resinae]|nr:MAG: hypothetical protein M1819_004923 [Sarea resinae]